MINLTEHDLVPEHVVMTSEEKEELLKRSESKLKGIYRRFTWGVVLKQLNVSFKCYQINLDFLVV